MQHNENSKPNRFQHFLREKGYYIVLALCICAVGVSGWLFLSGAIAEKHALSEPAMSVATETEIPSQPAKTPTQPSASKPAAVTKPAESAPVSQTDEQVYAQAANVRVWPVSGETQSAYSMEQLAFNPTTRDWRNVSVLIAYCWRAMPRTSCRYGRGRAITAVCATPLTSHGNWRWLSRGKPAMRCSIPINKNVAITPKR